MFITEKFKNACRENPQKIIFAEAEDERIIKAADYLLREGLSKPVLHGGIYELRDMADKINIATRKMTIVNPMHEKEYKPFAEQLLKNKPAKYAIESLVKDSVIQSVLKIKYGLADIALSGNNSTMAITARAAIQYAGISQDVMKASSFYMLVSPNQQHTIFFADCSVNINPTARDIAETAVATAKNYELITGIEPRIALLSFSTMGSAKHESIDRVNEALKIVRSKNLNLICDGEIQFDAAINSVVAEKKAPNSSLKGNANVFIFPSLNSGNIGQKILEHIGGYFSIGPMFQGLNHDVHHLPKSYSVEGIINSALLASYIKISKLKN